MTLTPSTMIPLGTKAPEFKLPDTVSGKEMALGELKSDVATVVMFICNHCPYVKHVQRELVKLANDFIPSEVHFIAISSNDAESYPDDAPDQLKDKAEELGYSFPFLYDESQEVAKAYSAACTPDFFVFDKNLQLVYRGQLDDSRPGNGVPITGKDLRQALQNVIDGKSVPENQKPSMGCNIKWKS